MRTSCIERVSTSMSSSNGNAWACTCIGTQRNLPALSASCRIAIANRRASREHVARSSSEKNSGFTVRIRAIDCLCSNGDDESSVVQIHAHPRFEAGELRLGRAQALDLGALLHLRERRDARGPLPWPHSRRRWSSRACPQSSAGPSSPVADSAPDRPTRRVRDRSPCRLPARPW